ncbi:MAG: minor capsid protein [Dehalococcoidia bacterium]
MMLKEICQWIENHSSFVIGSTLIYGYRLTETPDHCILASERTSGNADFYLPDKIDKIITFVARSASYGEASQDMDDLFTLLHGSVGWDLPVMESGNAYHACIMQSLGVPVYLGEDERKLHEFSVNVEFKIQRQ